MGLPSAEGDREMRVPAGARRNGGYNIEITNATGCLQMTLSILYRRHPCRGRLWQIPPCPLSIFIMKRHFGRGAR